MGYYKSLGLEKEPFSTSPDPSFFYLSRVHRAALYRMRVAIELKRGLSIVVGDIGTGKTTLARRMSQIFHQDPRFNFHVLLNPMYHDEYEFSQYLLKSFHIPNPEECKTTVDCLQRLEKYLYQKGVEEKKTIILMIDEAQQLSEKSLEVLRTLLNYETNDYKLLQVVLFGQLELVGKLKDIPNFWDRIALKTRIHPLDERATGEMIRFRLRQAQYKGHHSLIQDGAIRQIYKATKGFPRRINTLCHDALEMLVMTGQKQVSRGLIKDLVSQEIMLMGAFR